MSSHHSSIHHPDSNPHSILLADSIADAHLHLPLTFYIYLLWACFAPVIAFSFSFHSSHTFALSFVSFAVSFTCSFEHSFAFESFSLAFVHSFALHSFSFPSFLSLQSSYVHLGLALVASLAARHNQMPALDVTRHNLQGASELRDTSNIELQVLL